MGWLPVLLVGILLCGSITATAAEPTPQELTRQIDAYQDQLRLHADDADTLNRLGFAFYRLGMLSEAIDAYQRALSVTPGYATACNNLGAAHLARKEYVAGEAAFREALQRNPAYVKAAYNLAVALYHQSRYFDAYKAYCHAKKIDASYVRQRLDKDRARAELQKKLQDNPDDELLQLALKRLDDE